MTNEKLEGFTKPLGFRFRIQQEIEMNKKLTKDSVYTELITMASVVYDSLEKSRVETDIDDGDLIYRFRRDVYVHDSDGACLPDGLGPVEKKVWITVESKETEIRRFLFFFKKEQPVFLACFHSKNKWGWKIDVNKDFLACYQRIRNRIESFTGRYIGSSTGELLK